MQGQFSYGREWVNTEGWEGMGYGLEDQGIKAGAGSAASAMREPARVVGRPRTLVSHLHEQCGDAEMRQWHDTAGWDGNGDLTGSSTSSEEVTDNARQSICPYKQPSMDCAARCSCACLNTLSSWNLVSVSETKAE